MYASRLTDQVAVDIAVLERAEGLQRGLLEGGGDCEHISTSPIRSAHVCRDSLGWASFMAALGFALVVGS